MRRLRARVDVIQRLGPRLMWGSVRVPIAVVLVLLLGTACAVGKSNAGAQIAQSPTPDFSDYSPLPPLTGRACVLVDEPSDNGGTHLEITGVCKFTEATSVNCTVKPGDEFAGRHVRPGPGGRRPDRLGRGRVRHLHRGPRAAAHLHRHHH